MTLTTSARPPLKSRRWSGFVFGLIVGVVVICHGCHLGDHDDELSASGRQRAIRAGSVSDGPRPSLTLPARKEGRWDPR